MSFIFHRELVREKYCFFVKKLSSWLQFSRQKKMLWIAPTPISHTNHAILIPSSISQPHMPNRFPTICIFNFRMRQRNIQSWICYSYSHSLFRLSISNEKKICRKPRAIRRVSFPTFQPFFHWDIAHAHTHTSHRAVSIDDVRDWE